MEKVAYATENSADTKYSINITKKANDNLNMMPGSKGLNPHELAHRWMKDLGTRPDMSIKVG